MIEGQQTNCDAPEMPDFPDPQLSNESGEASKEEHYLATDTLISEEIMTTLDKLNKLSKQAQQAGLTVTFYDLPGEKFIYCSVSRIIQYVR